MTEKDSEVIKRDKRAKIEKLRAESGKNYGGKEVTGDKERGKEKNVYLQGEKGKE
jgi:hypothetical protein